LKRENAGAIYNPAERNKAREKVRRRERPFMPEERRKNRKRERK